MTDKWYVTFYLNALECYININTKQYIKMISFLNLYFCANSKDGDGDFLKQ